MDHGDIQLNPSKISLFFLYDTAVRLVEADATRDVLSQVLITVKLLSFYDVSRLKHY